MPVIGAAPEAEQLQRVSYCQKKAALQQGVGLMLLVSNCDLALTEPLEPVAHFISGEGERVGCIRPRHLLYSGCQMNTGD